MVFMLTRAAGAYLRPGPIYPHQIVPGQNVPYIPQCGRTRKPEASRRFAAHANRGVEIACDFVCRENTSGKSNFCVLLFADKRTWLPGIGQRGCCRLSADIFSQILGVVWPRGQNQRPFVQAAAATTFFRREKGGKTRCSPAPNGLRLTAPPTAPNGLSKSTLLMRPGCGRLLFCADTSDSGFSV